MSKQEIQAKSSGGLTCAGLLGVAFVVLKLCGVINWSWWLVLLPFYGGLALVGVFLLLALVFAFIGSVFDHDE